MLFVINFKTYEEGTADKAENLAKKLEVINSEVIITVQNSDIHRISNSISAKVFAQHVDPQSYGSNTGKNIPETLKANGASGVLINHSEDLIDLKTIEENVKRCKDLNLTTIVCVDTPELAEKVSSFNPNYIAIEPPELIGSGISVSETQPEIITNTIKKSNGIKVLCGAGITKGEDITKAKELGCVGILVASGIVTAKNPERIFKEFVEAVKD